MRILMLMFIFMTTIWSEEDVPLEAYINIYRTELSEAGKVIKTTEAFGAHVGNKLRYWKIKGKPLDFTISATSAADMKTRILKLATTIVNEDYEPSGKSYYINFGFSNESGSLGGGFYCSQDNDLPTNISEIVAAIKNLAGDSQ